VALAISTWIATLDGSHAGPGEAIKRSAFYAGLVFVCLAVNDSCVYVKIRALAFQSLPVTTLRNSLGEGKQSTSPDVTRRTLQLTPYHRSQNVKQRDL
jgi:hypothetical protein